MTYVNAPADSDSVNPGSSPGSPANKNIDLLGVSGRGQIRHPGQTAHTGRTQVGTGEVYFISDGDAIKIGYSGAAETRLRRGNANQRFLCASQQGEHYRSPRFALTEE
jgi:hypothetical protein